MATILSDGFSLTGFGKLGDRILKDQQIKSAYLATLQNLVLCDKFLVVSSGPAAFPASLLKSALPDVVCFIEELIVNEELAPTVTKVLAWLRPEAMAATYCYDSGDFEGLGFFPNLTSADDKQNQDRHKNNQIFIERGISYLNLARALNVYIALHPTRCEFIKRSMQLETSQLVSSMIVEHFDNAIGATKPASFIGSELSIPAVAEHVLSFAIRNSVEPLVAVNEVRHSKHAVAFRRRCSEIESEITEYGTRGAFRNMQKLLKDVDASSKKWMEDIDEGVKYKARTIQLGGLSLIGPLLRAVGLNSITIKDPILIERQPALLFLNDLYRAPGSIT